MKQYDWRKKMTLLSSSIIVPNQPISDDEHLNRSMNHRIFKCIMSQCQRSLVIRFPVSSFNRKKMPIFVADMIIEYFRDPFKLEGQ